MVADPMWSNLRWLWSNLGPTSAFSQVTENNGPVQPVQPVQPFFVVRAGARARSGAPRVLVDLGIAENRLDRLDRLDRGNQINGLSRSNLSCSSSMRLDRLDHPPAPPPCGSFPAPRLGAAQKRREISIVVGTKPGATIPVQRNDFLQRSKQNAWFKIPILHFC